MAGMSTSGTSTQTAIIKATTTPSSELFYYIPQHIVSCCW